MRAGLLAIGALGGGLLIAVPVVSARAVDAADRTTAPTTAPTTTPTTTRTTTTAASTPTPAVPAPSEFAPSAAESQITPAAPARPAPGPASIGVLAQTSAVQSHSCTAAVVSSSGGDVIVTAAHCVVGTGAGLVFAPGYRHGAAPYGTWDVRAAFVDPAWLTSQDPDDDVAFLVVAPSASNPNREPVQAAVGGFALGQAPAAGAAVQVTGYVVAADDPIACGAVVYPTAGYPSFDCDGFAGGTSGGPWVATGANGADVLAGVIGGPHQGGCVESTSYSSPFTTGTAALLVRAESGGAADTLPSPGGDGC